MPLNFILYYILILFFSQTFWEILEICNNLGNGGSPTVASQLRRSTVGIPVAACTYTLTSKLLTFVEIRLANGELKLALKPAWRRPYTIWPEASLQETRAQHGSVLWVDDSLNKSIYLIRSKLVRKPQPTGNQLKLYITMNQQLIQLIMLNTGSPPNNFIGSRYTV